MRSLSRPNPSLVYVAAERIPSDRANSIQIMKMCEAFAAHGLDVELLLPWRAQTRAMGLARTRLFTTYAVRHPFRVRWLPAPDFMPLMAWLGGVGAGALFNAQSIVFALTAAFLLLRRAPDVVYTRNVWVAAVLRAFLGLRVVIEFHMRPRGRLRTALVRVLIRSCPRLVVLTSHGARWLRRLGATQAQVLVAPDAHDPELFRSVSDRDTMRRRLGFGTADFVVGYSGGATTAGEGKGLEHLLDAAGRMAGAGVRVLLVGISADGLRPFHLTLPASVVAVGRRPLAEVPSFLAACDVLAMPFPATEHYATMMSPLKLFEYLAAGKPIIATDLPSLRDILDETTALLLPTNAPEEIRKAVQTLRGDPALQRRLSAAALERSKRFTWAARADAVLRFLGIPSAGTLTPSPTGLEDSR